MNPTSVKDYTIIETIGAGTYAKVYKAKQKVRIYMYVQFEVGNRSRIFRTHSKHMISGMYIGQMR